MVEPGDVPGWPTDPSEGTMPESEDAPPSIALWESDPGESKTVGGIRVQERDHGHALHSFQLEGTSEGVCSTAGKRSDGPLHG